MKTDRVGRRFATVLVALGLLPIPALSQTQESRVDSLFRFANSSTPGCAVGAVRDGKAVLAKGYGVANLEHDIPITARSAFYLASVSKQFTAAAINLLVAEGKLSLDDDVRKFVPEVPVYEAPITIRHLLHHTSGLRDYLTLFSLSGRGDLAVNHADFLAMVSRQRTLNFRPGTQYSYSNTGYVLLSLIVERVTGKPLRVFAQERLFQPLGMSSTQFRDRHTTLIKGRAIGYAQNAGGGFRTSSPDLNVVGDGGLYSTIEDLVRWEANTVAPQIGDATWTELQALRASLVDGSALRYGAGINHADYRGTPAITHGGSLGGYNTAFLRIPSHRFSGIVLCNSNTVPAGVLVRGLTDIYLGDVVPSPAAQRPSASVAASDDLAKHTGTYFSDQVMQVYRIALQNGKLYYVRGTTNRSELTPLGGGRFQVAGAQMQFVASPTSDTMRVEVPGSPTLIVRRVTAGKTPDLRAYAGTYTSEELGITWTVTARDSALTIRPARGDSLTAERLFGDTFRAPPVTASFVRDARGRIIAMDVSEGERARRIRFARQGK